MEDAKTRLSTFVVVPRSIGNAFVNTGSAFDMQAQRTQIRNALNYQRIQ
jgi:hypothetical protein